ncbi:MAG: hypothetical protein HQM10_16795 [Candidatus Riflebacteria bacterium]|nr:hypothetical protein [Candidatus Riflebacteria bacterium]
MLIVRKCNLILVSVMFLMLSTILSAGPFSDDAQVVLPNSDSGGSQIEAATIVDKKVVKGSEATEGEILAVFHSTVNRMIRQGNRLPGKGVTKGIANNVAGYYKCIDQAEELRNDLWREFGECSQRGWRFSIGQYAGVGHEGTGHYWLNAIPTNLKKPVLVLDPWAYSYGRFHNTGDDPVIPKGFFTWLLGSSLDYLGLID